MISLNQAPLVTSRVTIATPLAAPYYYRRAGVYYLRLRPVGLLCSHTVSLRSTDRTTAMQNSKDLRTALAGFHLDNPQADWESIRSAIREFALEALQFDHSNDPMQSYGMVYDDLKRHLIGHAMTSPMTPIQARGVEAAIAAVNGAQKRLNGDLGALNEILDEDGLSCGTSTPLSPSISVIPSADALTFEGLSTIYIKEHKATRTQFYSGEDHGVFMLPMGFSSLSFREGPDGDIWNVTTTRNPAIQGWDLEVTGVADVIAQGKVRLKLANPADPTEKFQTETVSFPLITRVVFAAE